ncbi:MAG: amino acid racemase [Atopobiaceae bacterium]|nr:amino acid racemase [Atopobiaceae bacterium]
MRKFGLIGGCGPESTVPYYLGIVNGVRERVGKPFFPNMTIESLSCFDVMRMVDAGDLEGLTDYFSAGIERLHAAGCEVAALGCNTGHIVFGELERRSPIPLVSIVDATRDEALRRGYRRVMLLGTVPTMRDAYFKAALAKAGMLVLSPGGEDRAWLGRVIAEELELGIVRGKTIERFARLVAEGVEHGVDAVILGCTELPMLAERVDLGLPVLDTLQLHVRAIVDAIMM